MKLECQRERLKQAIGLAERVTGKNLSLPILGQILLSASEHSLVIRSTNLDLGCEWRLPAKVSAPGEILVPGAVLHNFLATISGVDKITLATEGANLMVATANSSTVVKVQSGEEFPSLPELDQVGEFSLAAGEFISAARATSYAAALTDIKPEIASIYLHTSESNMYLVATDSFRLAEKRLAVNPVETGEEVRLILPIRNVAEIMRLLEAQSGDMSWHHNRNQLTIKSDQLTVTSRLVDGIFPDYRQIMPAKSLTQVTLDREVLLNSLRLSQIFTDRLNHVTLKVRPEDGTLELTSQNGEVGENTSLLPAEISGEELTVSFNLRYLLDGLQALADDQVQLQFNGRTKPILLTGLRDDTFRYLIMPLNR